MTFQYVVILDYLALKLYVLEACFAMSTSGSAGPERGAVESPLKFFTVCKNSGFAFGRS